MEPEYRLSLVDHELLLSESDPHQVIECLICSKSKSKHKIKQVPACQITSNLSQVLSLNSQNLQFDPNKIKTINLCTKCLKNVTNGTEIRNEIKNLEKKLNKIVKYLTESLSLDNFLANKKKNRRNSLLEAKSEAELRELIISELGTNRDKNSGTSEIDEDISTSENNELLTEETIKEEIESDFEEVSNNVDDVVNISSLSENNFEIYENTVSNNIIYSISQTTCYETDLNFSHSHEAENSQVPVTRTYINRGLFSKKTEKLLEAAYLKSYNFLTDRKLPVIIKCKIWTYISQILSSIANVIITPAQCKRKMHDKIHRYQKKKFMIHPDWITSSSTPIGSHEPEKIEEQLKILFKEISELSPKGQSLPPPCFSDLIPIPKPAPKINKLKISPKVPIEKPLVKLGQNPVFSLLEEKILVQEYSRNLGYLLRKNNLFSTSIYEKISLIMSKKTQLAPKSIKKCAKKMNHLLYPTPLSNKKTLQINLKNSEISLENQVGLIGEWANLKSCSHWNLGKNYEIEKKLWRRISMLVHLKNSKKLRDIRKCDKWKIYQNLKPENCFNWLNGSLKVDEETKSYVWRASTNMGEIELKIPSLKLVPIEILNSSVTLMLNDLKKIKEEIFPISETQNYVPDLSRIGKLKEKIIRRRKHQKKNQSSSSNINIKCNLEGCDETFNKLRKYQIHRNKFHRDAVRAALQSQKFPCGSCDKIFKIKNDMIRHDKRVHQKILDFKCQHCSTKYATANELKYHLVYKHEDKNVEENEEVVENLTCKICNIKFSPNYLRLHMMAHEGTHPHKCTYDSCNFGTFTPTSLKKHIDSVHLKLREFQCHICPKSYPGKYRLLHHLSVHEGTNVKAECDICHKFFSHKMALKKHKMSVHFKENRYICQTCGKGFPHLAYLRTHEKSCLKKHAQILSN